MSQYVGMAIDEARRAGVDPALFLSLVQQESRWNPNAVSPAGAFGLTQAMPDTARQPGYGVRPLMDTQNPREQLRFGADYFKAMLTKYGGDRDKALAAYNWGPGNVDGWSGDHNLLPSETRDYISNITAMYGSDDQAYLPDGTIMTGEGIDTLLGGPQSSTTDYAADSLLATPEEDNSFATLNPSALLAGLGQAFSASATGRRPDFSIIAQKQIAQERNALKAAELRQEAAETFRSLKAMGDLAKEIGGPALQAVVMETGDPQVASSLINAFANRTHKTEMQAAGFAHEEAQTAAKYAWQSGENALDRNLKKDMHADDVRVAESRLSLRADEIEQKGSQFTESEKRAQYEFDKTYELNRQKFAAEQAQYKQDFAREQANADRDYDLAVKRFDADSALATRRLDDAEAQFKRTHALNKENAARASQEFLLSLKQDEDQFGRKLSADQKQFNAKLADDIEARAAAMAQEDRHFNKTHEQRLVEATQDVIESRKRQELDERKFELDRMADAREAEKYANSLAAAQAQGVAYQSVIVESLKANGQQELAEYIDGLSGEFFTSPAAQQALNAAIEGIYGNDSERTSAIEEAIFLASDAVPQDQKDALLSLKKAASATGTPEDRAAYEKLKQTVIRDNKDLIAYAEEARTSKTTLQVLDRMIGVIEAYDASGRELPSGIMTEALLPFKKLGAELFGMDFEGMSEQEIIVQLHKQVFPGLRPIGSGATSDFEQRIYAASFPNVSNSPDVLRRQLAWHRGRVVQNQAYANFLRSEYAAQDGVTLADVEDTWDDLAAVGDPRTAPIVLRLDEFTSDNMRALRPNGFRVGDSIYMDGEAGFVVDDEHAQLLNEEFLQ